MITLSLKPYWKIICNHYYDTALIDMIDEQVNIWVWLEREYKARKVINKACISDWHKDLEIYNRYCLEFDDDKDATLFILRWS